jgi:glycosyltransferase involved in cell wall biosynthesis
LPITLLEAMSHGRACLASDIPPHLSIIEDGKNGFLHRAGDINHLRQRLINLIHAPATYLAGIGEAARRKVIEEHDWEKVTEETERLYQAVLTTPRSARHDDERSVAHHRTAERV